MKTLAIVGASGHGKVVADAALTSGRWDKVVFYDDAWPEKSGNGIFEVIGNSASLVALEDKPEVIVAIGDNKVRLVKQMELVKNGFVIATLVHPTATIATSVNLGSGTVVLAGAVINADARVGAGCIVNSNAVVEHDCELATAVHISPGASLAGGVSVGEASWIGIGAVVIQAINIGKNVVVGAGSVVIDHLPDNVTAVGVPVKIIK